MAISGITKLRKTAAQNITTGAWRTVTWDVEDYDNLGAVDLGSSSSNIVVPSGITIMRATLFMGWANSGSSGRYLNLTDNTTSYLLDIRNAVNEAFASVSSGWVSISAATTIHLEVNSGGNTLNLGGTFGTYPNLTIEWATGFAALHA
jgi:hypothetical protein